ncbi:hypothetical protein GTP46_27700 [Duganella sp. FT135W]|uniref:Uncharacterized protein n=1 Tax=Duganella flavida TaxID=2692175 RepID=A0A6L8KI37_9BURK|nr:MHFG family PEP-CTERM protein [Duganella flavida]MYM26417.1 hypothetical protein [Duganella flavida]
MPLTLALALASVTAAVPEPSCSWDHPGRNPYRGSIVAAIDHYTDIPPAVASTLKRRMAEDQPDDQVTITRDAITGREQYSAHIRAMHFGTASVCASVTRDGWSPSRQEPAKVYCVGTVCILVPRICGNISRVTRLQAPSRNAANYYGAPAGVTPQGATTAQRHAPAAATQAVPSPAAPLRSALQPEPSTAPAHELPELGMPQADTPAPEAQAQSDDALRNRLPGRATEFWPGANNGWYDSIVPDGGSNGGGGGGNIPSAIPEPSGGAMLAMGLAVLAIVRRLTRRSRK